MFLSIFKASRADTLTDVTDSQTLTETGTVVSTVVESKKTKSDKGSKKGVNFSKILTQVSKTF